MNARRAFALPLVLLLAMIVTLAGAVLLDMQTDTTRSVNRYAKVYEDHHLAAGMRELLDQWLMTGGNLRERLEDDGEAFRLELPHGHQIRVLLEDAQGTVLRDLSTLDGPIARYAQRIVQTLEPLAQAREEVLRTGTLPRGSAGRDAQHDLFRMHGPVAISVNSASEAVLDAVAQASGDPSGAARLIREIRARVARADRTRGISAEDLASAIAESSLEPAHRRELSAILTAQPVLYRMTIETRLGALSTSPTKRTTALVLLPGPNQPAGSGGTVVLSWEDDSQSEFPAGSRP